MININRAYISKVVLHRVGHKVREEKNIVSNELLAIPEHLEEDLRNYFLKSFKGLQMSYEFTHQTSLDCNAVYNSCEMIFSDERDFLKASQYLLDILYEQSTHPSIKLGELFVVHFGDIMYNDILTEAIGIFKVERKNKFFNFIHTSDGLGLELRKGFNTGKIDKAALIVDRVSTTVHSVFSIDNNNYDAAYWKKQFLNIKPIVDNSFQTDHYLKMCKDFSEDIVIENFDTQARATFLGNTLRYFNENPMIENTSFKEEIFEENKDLLEEFNTYQQEYSEASEIQFSDSFEVDSLVLKSYRKAIKMEIKLDTKMKIVLDSNSLEEVSEYLEKGFDEDKKMNFYKVYFDTEMS